jgi:hypothetical protein
MVPGEPGPSDGSVLATHRLWGARSSTGGDPTATSHVVATSTVHLGVALLIWT